MNGLLKMTCAFVPAYPGKIKAGQIFTTTVAFVIITERYATAIIRHLGNFDACSALFQIQNGCSEKRVYWSWRTGPKVGNTITKNALGKKNYANGYKL